MARQHPVTVRINEAIDALERNEMEITPASVKVNTDISWKDWTPDQAASEALDTRIARCLRNRGYVIADSGNRDGGRVRKDFWTSTIEELEEQNKVKSRSSDYDLARLKADELVVEFLREKEAEFGYEVYPGLFHSDIDRIYSMQGITPPGGALDGEAA